MSLELQLQVAQMQSLVWQLSQRGTLACIILFHTVGTQVGFPAWHEVSGEITKTDMVYQKRRLSRMCHQLINFEYTREIKGESNLGLCGKMFKQLRENQSM